MAVPATLIPVAISAVRSLVQLRGRLVDIRDTQRIDDPLPLLLPALPPNLIVNATKDPGRMLDAFRADAVHRAALEARGLVEQFDKFDSNIDPLTGQPLEQERHADLFWRFMGLYYQIERQKTADQTADIEVDETGLDRFLVKSAEAGGGTAGVKMLRATAEILTGFLGDNASLFLARSSNKLILSSVLREFATRSDFEADGPQRLLKLLVGSVAVAAADHGAGATDHPAAVFLFGSLGRVRQELGDDFVARIASHEGFSAVVSDWVGSLPTDPYMVELMAEMGGLDDGSYDPADPSTLPARLQPVFGALTNTLSVIGDNIGTAEPLSKEASFRAVFAAVLRGVTQNSTALLREEVEGDRFMATLLQAVIATVGRAGPVQDNDLIAPVFADLMDQLAIVVPDAGQDAALTRAEVILQDLALRITSGETQAALAELDGLGGPGFARGLMVELFAIARNRSDLLLEGESERAQAVAAALLGQMPQILRLGLDRDAALRLFRVAVSQLFPDDSDEGAFVRDLLPQVAQLASALLQGRSKPEAEVVEAVMTRLLARIADDRPVWQVLHQAAQMQAVVGALSDVLSGQGGLRHLPPMTLLEIADQSLGVFSRHGLKLSDLAVATANPEAFVREKTAVLFDQAVTAGLDRLGRAAGGSDLAPIVHHVLVRAFANTDPVPLSADDLAATVEAALLRLTPTGGPP